MLFDVNLLFFHATNTYAFTAGEYVSLVGDLSITASCTSSVINLGVAEDMGIGDGEFVPKLALFTGTAITTSSASAVINFAFQGSTDSSTWTTYLETGYNTTASYGANTPVFMTDVPRRPSGVALPQYYRILMSMIGNPTQAPGLSGGIGISTGNLIGGIVIQRGETDTFGQYPSGFTVA